MRDSGHLLELDLEQVNGGEPLQIVVVSGYGRTQRNSYGWIGNKTGWCLGLLSRRQMRKLRDALNVALGEV